MKIQGTAFATSGVSSALKKGIVINPILYNLAQILESYGAYGIKVTVRGINFFDQETGQLIREFDDKLADQ